MTISPTCRRNFHKKRHSARYGWQIQSLGCRYIGLRYNVRRLWRKATQTIDERKLPHATQFLRQYIRKPYQRGEKCEKNLPPSRQKSNIRQHGHKGTVRPIKWVALAPSPDKVKNLSQRRGYHIIQALDTRFTSNNLKPSRCNLRVYQTLIRLKIYSRVYAAPAFMHRRLSLALPDCGNSWCY